MAIRPIDANVAIKKIQEYMEDFPKAFTWFATCRVILSMLGDENQIPTLTQPNELTCEGCIHEKKEHENCNYCMRASWLNDYYFHPSKGENFNE